MVTARMISEVIAVLALFSNGMLLEGNQELARAIVEAYPKASALILPEDKPTPLEIPDEPLAF